MALAMAADFDPEDKNSWYFGPITREETNAVLQTERDLGIFLVRDSKTISGDFVLCVKEDNKVSHYIINKINVGGTIRFRIGDQEFPDLPSLLNFYKTHFLDTTSLVRPAPREKYFAKFDFQGKDDEDLSFKRGEILTILQKDEEQWWTAKNSIGTTGLVPVPYITKYDAETAKRYELDQRARPSPNSKSSCPDYSRPPPLNGQRELPAMARVIKQRIPNAYDKRALKLEVGDEVKVTAMDITGQWEGECNGVKGLFPFTHIQFMDNHKDSGQEDEP
eukprot:GHVO01034170.1.p1 GENE.GHVO01034170.1~~GHVO01034170.1.p1  ORF type:complete len:277 (+),score=28.13 GHVO01034170.1:150-980(+)